LGSHLSLRKPRRACGRAGLRFSRHNAAVSLLEGLNDVQFRLEADERGDELVHRRVTAPVAAHARGFGRWLDQPFGLRRSLRISLNSVGPLRRRRFRCCRSSLVADGSASLSICWPAMSEAFDAAFGLRRLIGCVPDSPISTRRRMASGRLGGGSWPAIQASRAVNWSGCTRTIIGSPLPVAGGPLFFRDTTV
jgi:hypothetical protein